LENGIVFLPFFQKEERKDEEKEGKEEKQNVDSYLGNLFLLFLGTLRHIRQLSDERYRLYPLISDNEGNISDEEKIDQKILAPINQYIVQFLDKQLSNYFSPFLSSSREEKRRIIDKIDLIFELGIFPGFSKFLNNYFSSRTENVYRNLELVRNLLRIFIKNNEMSPKNEEKWTKILESDF
jgi:hypothetical protein